MPDGSHSERVTLATLRRWSRRGEKFAMLTCYDALTARHLWRGGVKTLLVGDTAAHVVLGHDSTLPAEMDFMIAITAAVRRGAPDAFVMADMPFGSYQCGDDEGVANAARFLKEGMADSVKLEVDPSHAPLVARMSAAGIPVVAHLGSRPQMVRARGRYRATYHDQTDVSRTVDNARRMVDAGAVMLLLEAVPAEVSQQVVAMVESRAGGATVKRSAGRADTQQPPQDTACTSLDRGTPQSSVGDAHPHDIVPVVGCGGGPACHGHVVVLSDMLGMTDWHPPFAPVLADVGDQIASAARQWADLVSSGRYLVDDHPYKLD